VFQVRPGLDGVWRHAPRDDRGVSGLMVLVLVLVLMLVLVHWRADL
jgi:hypothetical protein